ncbi:MAG: hypothetical protein M3328_00290, partial [Chloroflexota bacterium]|nr:hypothetical protein [Chloroflexota bacterium]
RGDDFSTGSASEMSTEDVSGEGTFTEQAAGESGYQMSGSMTSYESGSGENQAGDGGYGNAGGSEATDTMEQGDGDITRIDYDQQTGGLISSGRAGWANTSELSEGSMSGEAGGAGAPEFGSGDETEGGYGTSDASGDGGSQPDFSSGQQTIPFRNDYPGENSDTDNEPPHPGDTSTTDRSQTY